MEGKLAIRQNIIKLLFIIAGLFYVTSFFLPVVDYYGGPIIGYQLFISPLILATLVPNVFVIITFLKYKRIDLFLKIVYLIVVLCSAGFYILLDISKPYPLIDSLLIGYWIWFFSSIGIMLISLFEPNSVKATFKNIENK